MLWDETDARLEEEAAVQQMAGDLAGLIERAKHQDQSAFSDLYQLTVTPVYRYLSSRLNSVQEAEELTQEVFLSALTRIHSLRATDQTAMLAWLFQIARHKLADHLRKRYRHPTAGLAPADQLPAPDATPEELAEGREERVALREALDHLTPVQREVITCKYILGFDNERTARLVGKNINAVNQLQHRALASLHRLLAKAGRLERGR